MEFEKDKKSFVLGFVMGRIYEFIHELAEDDVDFHHGIKRFINHDFSDDYNKISSCINEIKSAFGTTEDEAWKIFEAEFFSFFPQVIEGKIERLN